MSAEDSLFVEEERIQKAYARRPHSNRYSRFNNAYLFMVHERERRLLRLLAEYGFEQLESKKLLEIGCGDGDLLRDFIKWGARPNNLFGIDVIPERVTEAIDVCPRTVHICRGNAARLEFPDDTFDLVLQSTVFTSVLDSDIKTRIAAEMYRVLKQNGLILWYDYHMNNPQNRDVKGVKSHEIEALFPNCEVRLQRITLAPPITRALVPYSWLLCYALSKIPWLCSHYIGVIQKKPVHSNKQAA
jgi:ubiquinone/menaquinone biosynthesis C-methylase UbiE